MYYNTNNARGLSLSHVEEKIANLSGFIDTSGATLYWNIIPSKNEGRRSDLSNGVSIESRLRLMRYTERLETAGYYPSHMLTATLQQWDNNVEKWKITKRTFLNDYLRKYEPIIGYLWFQEFQKRGAPHLHILLQIDDVMWDRSLEYFIHAWRKAVRKSWGYNIPSQSVDLHRMKQQDFRYARRYASKLEQKQAPFKANWGNWWGVGKQFKLPHDVRKPLTNEEILAIIFELQGCNISSVMDLLKKIIEGHTSRVWIANSVLRRYNNGRMSKSEGDNNGKLERN